MRLCTDPATVPEQEVAVLSFWRWEEPSDTVRRGGELAYLPLPYLICWAVHVCNINY